MGGLRGIIFDKDGTLFDFDATWGAWAQGMAIELAEGDPALAARLDQVGDWIGRAFGVAGAPVDHAAALLVAWSRQAGLPGFTALGIGAGAQAAAAEAAATSSSMKANPAALDAAALRAVMAAAG